MVKMTSFIISHRKSGSKDLEKSRSNFSKQIVLRPSDIDIDKPLICDMSLFDDVDLLILFESTLTLVGLVKNATGES